MKIGEYDIPEGWESMSCFNNCGFILIWQVGEGEDVGEKMDIHYQECPSFPLHKRFGKGRK